jgi:hypothetical protein
VLASRLHCVLRLLGVFDRIIEGVDRAETEYPGCRAAVVTRRELDCQLGFGVVSSVMRTRGSSA